MKYILKGTLIIFVIIVFIFSCGNSNTGNKMDDGSGDSNALANSNSENSGKVAGSCCFASLEEYQPFFPSPEGEIQIYKGGQGKLTGKFFCNQSPSYSIATLSYQVGKDQFLSLSIRDYCSNPDALEGKFIRRMETCAKDANAIMKNLFGGGIFKGFTFQSTTGNKQVYLLAVVDGRFEIQISGLNHLRMDALMELFGMIPISELANWKK